MRKKDIGLERERLEDMKEFERKYEEYVHIAGVDEAGRGPLAGPVVAGAVVLPKQCEILYLNDSKKLSPKLREALYEEILSKALAVGIGVASVERIEEINILQATYEAMREAVGKLGVRPDFLLVDAVHIPNVDVGQAGIIKGDARSVSIAAASIVAKVTRDRMMLEYDALYKEYGFDKHKGYGTKAHREAILRYGPSPIHRMSFLRKILT